MRPACEEVAAYILAGGASRRMGQSKARLLLDGTPLACHLAQRFAPHVSQVMLVAKTGQGLEDLGLPMLYDTTSEGALVHGFRTVLAAPGPRWRFICACDMPAVDADLLACLWREAMRAAAPGSCLRRPERSTPEPVPSLWRADVAISEAWGHAAHAWVRGAGLVERVATAAECARLANLNTPEAWHAFAARRSSETT